MSQLRDRIASMVFAFDDADRQDAVRALARDVGAMEARVAELARDLEQAKADRNRAAMDARNPLMAQLAELEERCKRLEDDEEWARVNRIKLRVTNEGKWYVSKPYCSSCFHAEGPTSSAAIRALRAKLATNMISIEDFATVHNACPAGRRWATQNCRDMQHVWETIRSSWLVWIALRPVVLDDKTLRLFAVYCARQMQPCITDAASLTAINVAERYANGLATLDELKAAQDAARDAAYQTRNPVAAVGWSCARANAFIAATYVADATTFCNTPTPDQQADWLRANAKPNWTILNEEPPTNQ